MNENENLVTEQVAENAEVQTAEQIIEQTPAKVYTQEEVDAIVGKKLARREAKLRKQYDRDYGDLMETLKAGTGKENVGEITDTFKQFYAKNGIKVPDKPSYSQRDIEVLANADAEEIIGAGFDEVIEEVDRLSALGIEKMSAKEKAIFRRLAEYRASTERGQELAGLGVPEDVYNSPEFKKFAEKFDSHTPAREIYEIHAKITQPKKEIKLAGSMKSGPINEVKDYYSPEEIDRLTSKDLDDPNVWAAVRRSMTGG